MRVVYTLNGKSSLFGGNSADSTTDVMAEALRQYHIDAHPLRLPRSLAVQAWWRPSMRRRVDAVLEQIGPAIPDEGVDILTHSKGSLVAARIMRATAPRRVFRRIIMVAPAMNRRQKWEDLNFESLVCIHNRRDRAILAGSVMPLHPFGFGGSHGFITPDPRVSNHEDTSRPGGLAHNHYFQEPWLDEWARFAAREVLRSM